jgi:dihydrodipicolinate synthase/N-acetylneuraminate lyase
MDMKRQAKKMIGGVKMNFTFALLGGLTVSLIVGFVNYNGSKALKYIANFDIGEKVQKKELMIVLAKIWTFIFVLSFFSFSILWYLAMLVWCLMLPLMVQFAMLWKRNGHSLLLLILSTAAVIIVSFIATPQIRIFIF